MEKMRLKLDMSFMELGMPGDTDKILVYRYPVGYIKDGKDDSWL